MSAPEERDVEALDREWDEFRNWFNSCPLSIAGWDAERCCVPETAPEATHPHADHDGLDALAAELDLMDVVEELRRMEENFRETSPASSRLLSIAAETLAIANGIVEGASR